MIERVEAIAPPVYEPDVFIKGVRRFDVRLTAEEAHGVSLEDDPFSMELRADPYAHDARLRAEAV